MLDFTVPLLKPILVLEDDPEHQRRVAHLFYQLGYHTEDLFFSQTIDLALRICAVQPVKLILVDLNLPDGSGIDFIVQARADGHDRTPMMVLSGWNTLETIYTALSVGATGYVLKETDDFELLCAIRTMLKGGAIIDPIIAKNILHKFKCSLNDVELDSIQVPCNLSEREIEILVCVSNGLSSREIAAALHISKYTVDVHIKHIYQKLEVNSRTKAIYAGKQMGLIH